AGASKRQWDEESIFDEIGSITLDVLRTAKRISKWMKEHTQEVWFGSGNQYGSMGMTILANKKKYYPIEIWTNGLIEIRFQHLLKGPFESEEKRRELLERLNKVDGINLAAESITGRPNIRLVDLSSEAQLTKFLEVIGWLVDELHAG